MGNPKISKKEAEELVENIIEKGRAIDKKYYKKEGFDIIDPKSQKYEKFIEIKREKLWKILEEFWEIIN